MQMSLEEIITVDSFKNAFPTIYYKIDPIKFRRSVIIDGKILHPPKIGKKIIITGHSDYPITDADVMYYKPKIWWGVNKLTRRPSVFSCPLGVDNRVPNFMNTIKELMLTERPPMQNLAYMNFDPNTYPVERVPVYEKFKDKTFVTVGQRKPPREFLEDIRKHKFVICPRGNGVDTYRMWETMYLGSIPIVKKDLAMEEFYDMPICFIDSWDQVTEDFLNNFKLNENVNREKLKISYWLYRVYKSVH